MTDQQTKKSATGSGSAVMPCYKRVAWSRSMSEEVIGALWCIVAILAYGFDITWLMWGAGLKAVSDQIVSIYFAVKEVRAVKQQLDRVESL